MSTRRWLAPKLRPALHRRLPRSLRAERVGYLAAACSGGVRGAEFANLLHQIDRSPILARNRVEVYTRGDTAFAAMRAAIHTARQEILLESYILRDDATGREFLDALGAAAARGVVVRVLADALGSWGTRAAFWAEMENRGIITQRFHRLVSHPFLQAFRDHRKILVVDREVAFTGGMNIGEEYGSFSGKAGDAWRDTHVRITGTAAWEMAVVFDEGWRRAGGDPLHLEPLAADAGDEDARVLLLDTQPRRGSPEKAAVLAALFAAARETLWLSNAYFAPGQGTIDSLAAVARRGVDVRLLTPGATDVPLVRHAGHGSFSQLLAAGVRIYEYQAAILHTKTLVVDGYAAVVGSSNLDFRSFHFNAECNVVIFDAPTGAALAAAFTADLAVSLEIDPVRWQERPLLHRVGDRFARWLSPVL